jgi:hypothetical protein
MTKRKKQAIILLALSVPMMWWGFTNFMSGTTNSNALAMGIALSCTLGSLFCISSLTMLITKNSLGIWNPDDKGKKDRGVLLASQTTVGDSSVQKEIINKKPKVNEMAEAKDTNIDKSVEEIRALEESLVQSEETIKKETLNAKTTTEKIAVLKHNLAKDKTVKELLAIVTDYQLKQ